MNFFDQLSEMVYRALMSAKATETPEARAQATAEIIEGMSTMLARSVAFLADGDAAMTERLLCGAEGYIALAAADCAKDLATIKRLVATARREI